MAEQGIRVDHAANTVTSVGAVGTLVNFSGVGGSPLNNVVEDTSPQLGGDLDMNGQNITAAGPTTISPTEMSYLDGVTSNIQTQLNALAGGSGGTVQDATNLWITATDRGTVAPSGTNGANSVDLTTDRVVAADFAKGLHSGILSGYSNRTETGATYAVVCGGDNNRVYAEGGGICGGSSNNVLAVGVDGFVGGGVSNTVDALNGAICGGWSNEIDDTSRWAFIGAGYDNLIETAGDRSAIVGGEQCLIQVANSFIGGGYQCDITAGQYSGILGGYRGIIQGTGCEYSAIVGGYDNYVTGCSHAAAIAGFQSQVTDEADYAIAIGGDDSMAIRKGEFVNGGGGLGSNGASGDGCTVSNNVGLAQASMAQNTWYTLRANHGLSNLLFKIEGSLGSHRVLWCGRAFITGTTDDGLQSDMICAEVIFAARYNGTAATILASTVTYVYRTSTNFEVQVVAGSNSVNFQVRTTGTDTPSVNWHAAVTVSQQIKSP